MMDKTRLYAMIKGTKRGFFIDECSYNIKFENNSHYWQIEHNDERFKGVWHGPFADFNGAVNNAKFNIYGIVTL